jgi:hypothetical protein
MTLEQAREILKRAIAIYNHSIHSTTKCMPFELFHKRTDRNFHMPPSAERVAETVYSDAQYAALQEKARNGMVQAAAKSVARYFLQTNGRLLNTPDRLTSCKVFDQNEGAT